MHAFKDNINYYFSKKKEKKINRYQLFNANLLE